MKNIPIWNKSNLSNYLKREPVETLDSIIGIKPYPNAYSREVLKNIKLLNFSDTDSAVPFGSYIYRIQKYPGDIDLVEKFENVGTVDDLVKKFKKKLVDMVKNIVNLRVHYMMEFKMGLDKFYDIDIGTLRNNVYTPNPQAFDIVKKFKDAGLLSGNDVGLIYDTIKDNKYLTSDHYDIIYNIFREKRVLRWSDEEILQGYKIEQDGSKITIEQALKYNSHVKIDMITKIEEKFVEITNFLFLVTTDPNNGKTYLVNFGIEYNDSYLQKRIGVELPKEIEKLFYSSFYYNPFKGAKRMWALARHLRDVKMLGLLKDLISGNVSLLYMLKSEIGTMLRLLERLHKNKKSFPKESINKNLELIKERIGYVITLNSDRYSNFINKLNDAINNNNIQDKINIMDSIEFLMQNIINISTIGYLKQHGITYIPHTYLPEQLSYIENVGVLIK